MEKMETIPELLERAAAQAPAIGAEGGVRPLTYGALRSLVRATVRDLNAMGIGRGDRVAMVLQNGPEAATAFLGIASGAIGAPFSPLLREEEYEFDLKDLRAKALVVEAGSESVS